jgi:hypothetical protein
MFEWYVAVGGQSRGPASTETVLAYLNTRDRGDIYVWQEGFDYWRLATDVPELRGANAPPASGSRAAQRYVVSALAGIVLLALPATLLLVGGSSKHDLALERQALDTRGVELLARIALPGSPLACLDGSTGETVEYFCEKLLFASPEQAAAAMAYVSAQLALFADYVALWRRTGREPAGLVNLRRVIEADRFGFVASVLATREGCTPERCKTLGLLNDARRVNANLLDRPFDSYIARYTADRPTGTPHPLASRDPDGAVAPTVLASGTSGAATALQHSLGSSAAAASTPTSMPTPPGRPLRSDIFLPSASSIPPISIMTTEPGAPGPTEHAGPNTGSAPRTKSSETRAASASAALKDAAAPGRHPVRSTDPRNTTGDNKPETK